VADSSLSILQVITSARYSGAERVVAYLSAALRDSGHRVVVACKPNATVQYELEQRAVAVRPLGISGKLNLLAAGRIAKLARQMDADIIHTHLSTASLWGAVAARRLGIPSLAHVHALNTKYWYLLADAIVTPSQGVRQHLIRQGVRPDRVHVVYNGIPAHRFTNLKPPERLYQELDFSPQQPVIGVVAHLSAKKGHRHLLAAIAMLKRRYPQIVCLIIGEGQLRGTLEQLVQQLLITDNVRFLGYRDDAVDIMQICDVIVLPSVAKEGLGLCLIEAALLGKPTVGSRAPGIDEAIVDGETGLLVPVADSTKLAEVIGRLLGNPDLRSHLGEAGRARAHRMFSMEAHTEGVEQLYRQLIAAH